MHFFMDFEMAEPVSMKLSDNLQINLVNDPLKCNCEWINILFYFFRHLAIHNVIAMPG